MIALKIDLNRFNCFVKFILRNTVIIQQYIMLCYCTAGQHLITAVASLKFGFQTTSW